MSVTYEIDSVIIDEGARTALRLYVDLPLPSTQGNGHLLPIAGWIWGRYSSVTGILVSDDSGEITSGSVGYPRPDVPRALADEAIGEDCGFTALVALVGVRPEFVLQLVAEMANGHRIRFAEIAGRKIRIDADRHPMARETPDVDLAPILVTSLGRTGTSWLMHILACHPEVVTYRRWPHELSASRFWLRTFRGLVERPHGFDAPAWFASAGPPSWWGRRNPFDIDGIASWYRGEYVELVGQSIRRAISSFYRALASSQGQEGVRYFAEKALPNAAGNGVHDLFPETREIILVRDFRSMVCSILAFNRKRGFDSFGREHVQSDEAFVEILGPSVSSLHEAARTRPASLIVRYEDLIAHPQETVMHILEYLSLPAADAAVTELLARAGAAVPGMAAHQTSPSGAESVARWRTQLTPSMIRSCNEQFGEALAAFGYL